MARRFLCIFAFAATAISCLAADRIVFSRIAPNDSTLYISNADGSNEQPLTQPGSLNYSPAWSPKGDWIAFTSERAGPTNLFRMHPDGGNVERLTTDDAYNDQAAFSPDSQQIVYVSTRAAGFANLWILDLATHKERPLTTGKGGDFRPAWSPDGQWIAFTSDRESNFPPAKGRWERLHLVDIFVMHPDGSGLKRVTQHGNFCGSPKWTTDSQSLVAYCMSADETWTYRTNLLNPFVKDGANQIFKIDIATGSMTPLTSGPGVKLGPSLRSTGEVSYLRGEGTKLEIVSAEGKVGPSGAHIGVTPPAWSPDGKRVVYSRITFGESVDPVKQWSRNPKFELYATTQLPAYDPTGTLMAVSTVVPHGLTSLMIVDGKGPAHPILQRNDMIIGPAWSPDSKQIVVSVGAFSAFFDFAEGPVKPMDRAHEGVQLAILNADGTGLHTITSGPNNNGFGSYSPDGKRIVYRTLGSEGQGLRILNLADGSITKLTDGDDNFPLWSPRGDLVTFTRSFGGDFEIMTVHPDGKNVTQLTHVHGNEAHMAWSPDGERILFSSSRTGFKDEALYTGAPQPYGEIFVMNYDGTHIEQLTDDQWEDGGPAWQPHPAAAAHAAQ